MARRLSVWILAIAISVSAQVKHVTANLDVPNIFTAPNQFTTLLYLGSGTAISQGNECSGVTQDSIGGTVTATAVLRTIDGSSVGHDIACVVVTATTANEIGEIVFPYISSFSSNSAASQHQAGAIEASGTSPLRLILTNNGASNRKNTMLWRSCVGGCGTDWQWVTDAAGLGNEDMSWIGGSGNVGLYITGNCPTLCATTFNNNTGAKQFLLDDGRHTATTNPEFALTNGHIGHGLLDSNPDNWGTATCSGSTVTVTFVVAFSNNTYKVFLTDQTTAGGARVSTKNTGSFVITCTGASDSVDYLVLGAPF